MDSQPERRIKMGKRIRIREERREMNVRESVVKRGKNYQSKTNSVWPNPILL